MAHGYSEDEKCGIRFDLVDNPSDDPKAVQGWLRTDFDLTPALIPEAIKCASGVLITTACGAGDDRLVDAFLHAGFDAYIANPTRHIDFASGLMFMFGLFYFLVLAEHEYAPEFSIEEAVERAQQLHGDWKHGTQGFRLFTKAGAHESTA